MNRLTPKYAHIKITTTCEATKKTQIQAQILRIKKYKNCNETVLVEIPDDGPLRPKHVVLE
jgi:hypothetical protein